MIIPKKYLYAVLNELSKASGRIEVTYPPTGRLFSVSFGENCELDIVSEYEYQRLRNDFLRYENKDSIPEREIPSGTNFRTCLYASSVLKSESCKDLEEVIEEGVSRELLKGKKPLFIGYDTNALSNRINVTVEDIISPKSKGGRPQIGYCLSGGVRDELYDILDCKYKQYEIEQLKLPGMDFARNFLNQPPKQSRMAYLGAVEFKQIISNPNCELIDSEGKGDEAIVNSYKKYEKNHDVELLLVTGDSIFTSRAQSKRLRTFWMKSPLALQGSNLIKCDYKNLIELIFCTAVIFGYINVGGIEVYGVWRGKSSEDWDDQRVNIEIANSQIKDGVLRDLRVIEAAKKR
jgi:hypothetical protein